MASKAGSSLTEPGIAARWVGEYGVIAKAEVLTPGELQAFLAVGLEAH